MLLTSARISVQIHLNVISSTTVLSNVFPQIETNSFG